MTQCGWAKRSVPTISFMRTNRWARRKGAVAHPTITTQAALATFSGASASMALI